MNKTIFEEALEKLLIEFDESYIEHPDPYHSYHEGIGLLDEEFSELKAEVYRKEHAQNPRKIASEACHVANVALKIMILAIEHEKKLEWKKNDRIL